MVTEITPYPISMGICVSMSMQISKHRGHIQEQVKIMSSATNVKGKERKSLLLTLVGTFCFISCRQICAMNSISSQQLCVLKNVTKHKVISFLCQQRECCEAFVLDGEKSLKKQTPTMVYGEFAWACLSVKALLGFPRMGGNC